MTIKNIGRKKNKKNRLICLLKSHKVVVLMTDFFGVLVLVLLSLRFFYGFSIVGTDIALAVFAVYLSYYVSRKELHRWLKKYNASRPGEAWVVIWLIVAVFMVILKSIYPHVYYLPKTELTIIVPFVLAQYLYSREAKRIYQRRKAKNN